LRAIALVTPKMWTGVYIGRSASLPLAELYVERSVAMPLDLEVKFKETEPTQAIEAILDVLTAQSNRWSTLHVDFDTAAAANRFADRCQTIPVPVLPRIQVLIRNGPRSVTAFPYQSTLGPQLHFSSAPKLKSIHMEGGALFVVRPVMTHITVLHLTHSCRSGNPIISVSAIQRLFDSAPTLIDLTITGTVVDLTSTLARRMPRYIRSSSIRSLTLRNNGHAAVGRLLWALVTPRLVRVFLDSATEEDFSRSVSPASPFFFERKFPNVRELALRSPALPYRGISRLSRIFPLVTHLCLKQTSCDETALIAAMAFEALWPRLRQITVGTPATRERVVVMHGSQRIEVSCDGSSSWDNAAKQSRD
jgi:hypothetical protein